ncbi:unnamed protein product [Caenorhabditis angaria]|uniref:Cell death abnormality protein 8 n=1 Tax=Caenorhabditis angaria TaxID=860376 RepID=A0A9P1J6K1_9PELO|nr:unnamed protein product [Caenorhabditis angaria]
MTEENLEEVQLESAPPPAPTHDFFAEDDEPEKYKIKTLITTKFFKNFDDIDLGIVHLSTDRIPSVLQVRDIDIICFVFAMLTYCLDLYTDVLTAAFHAAHDRFNSSIAIIGITIFSSLVLTATSRHWMLHTDVKYHRTVPKKRLVYRLDNEKYITWNRMKVFLLFQAGPIYWLYKAFYYAMQFRKYEHSELKRRYYFKKMVEAERDASILRIIEAFLESAPQLVVQGVIAYSFIFLDKSQTGIPIFFWFQAFSMFVSIISLSWGIVVQNRSFRMFRDDKLNLWPREIILMFLWRFFTIFSRIWVLVIITVSPQAIQFYFLHLGASYLHVALLQPVEMKTKFHEFGAAMVNTVIHFFAPMNIAEGETRWRYATAYAIELFEMIYGLNTMFEPKTENAYALPIYIMVVTSHFIGIGFMITYYKWFHPNIRNARETKRQTENSEEAAAESTKPEEMQLHPEAIELKEVSVAVEAMRIAGDVINVINDS